MALAVLWPGPSALAEATNAVATPNDGAPLLCCPCELDVIGQVECILYRVVLPLIYPLVQQALSDITPFVDDVAPLVNQVTDALNQVWDQDVCPLVPECYG